MSFIFRKSNKTVRITNNFFFFWEICTYYVFVMANGILLLVYLFLYNLLYSKQFIVLDGLYKNKKQTNKQNRSRKATQDKQTVVGETEHNFCTSLISSDHEPFTSRTFLGARIPKTTLWKTLLYALLTNTSVFILMAFLGAVSRQGRKPLYYPSFVNIGR